MDRLNAMVEIKKAVLHGAGDLRIESELYDPAKLGPDELFVRTEVTGFSTGTDLGNYEGRSTEVPGAPGYPSGVGYSNVGVVEHVGSEVSAFTPGDRVSVRSTIGPHISGVTQKFSYPCPEQQTLNKRRSPIWCILASLP